MPRTMQTGTQIRAQTFHTQRTDTQSTWPQRQLLTLI